MIYIYIYIYSAKINQLNQQSSTPVACMRHSSTELNTDVSQYKTCLTTAGKWLVNPAVNTVQLVL